jgi:hypothetical protein
MPDGNETYRRPGTPRETPAYKPYTNPYDTRRGQQQTPDGGQRTQQQRQYYKPDAYQQWKERSKAWDPTKDDAYLDDLMRQNRR